MTVSFIYSLSYWLLFVVTIQLSNAITPKLIITRHPDNQTICVGDRAVMNCGFYLIFTKQIIGYTITPDARINGKSYGRSSQLLQPMCGLPLQFVAPANDTNSSRIIIGPVGKQFVGMMNFECAFITVPPPSFSRTVVLTVLGSPPRTPTIKVEEIRLDSFTISWTVIPDVSNICGPLWYRVTSSAYQNFHLIYKTNLTFSGLRHTTNYYVGVVPFNKAGEGIPATITVTTSGVPAIVPNVTVDNSTINNDGNNITLTLSWGEPFNNHYPIVNYTVSCSGDVTCPPNFTTTDNTTRSYSYTITNFTLSTRYIFSVLATNSIGSGEAGVVMITTPGIKFHKIKINGGSRTSHRNYRSLPHRRGRDYN